MQPKKKPPASNLVRRKLVRKAGPEGKLSLTKRGRARFLAKFGLTRSRIFYFDDLLEKMHVSNTVAHAVLLSAMTKMLGSLRGKQILELGAGDCSFASALKKMGAKPAILDEYGGNPRVDVEKHAGLFEDVGRLFKGRNFNAVVSNWAFGEYSTDEEVSLRGIYGALGPGGYFICSTSERATKVSEDSLKKAGFKIVLGIKLLDLYYGLDFVSNGIFIAQKPK